MRQELIWISIKHSHRSFESNQYVQYWQSQLSNGLFILHVECTNALLNGHSDWEIYVRQPEGFVDSIYLNKVLDLNKALCGLKQAPRI